MLFFNNNYLANMKEFCIALTVTGSLLFVFHIFYFLYICSVSCYTIFKKEKYAQIDLFVNIVVLSLKKIKMTSDIKILERVRGIEPP